MGLKWWYLITIISIKVNIWYICVIIRVANIGMLAHASRHANRFCACVFVHEHTYSQQNIKYLIMIMALSLPLVWCALGLDVVPENLIDWETIVLAPEVSVPSFALSGLKTWDSSHLDAWRRPELSVTSHLWWLLCVIGSYKHEKLGK